MKSYSYSSSKINNNGDIVERQKDFKVEIR